MKFSLLTTLFLILLTHPQNIQAQEYVADLSIDLPSFEKQALSPKDEVWVVDFWASWCRPCVHAIPHMKQIQEKYKDQGVRFVSISWDRNEIKWQNALAQFKMPWNHLWVPKGQETWLERHFPHKGIPTAFIIDRDGKIKKVNDVYKLDKAIYRAL